MVNRPRELSEEIDDMVGRYVESGSVDPHTAELILHHYAQKIRRKHGEPTVTVTEIKRNYGLDFGE